MSTRSQIAATVSLWIAIPSGLFAAFGSQVTLSSPHYRQLFLLVAVLTMLCVIGTAVHVFSAEGIVRYLPVPVAVLALAACIEFGARLLGVRLLG
jgi:hypothetical protein